MPKIHKRVAVITGADRGIGFEVCRQLGKLGYQAVLTAPDPAKGKEAAKKLLREGIEAAYHALDVANERHVRKLREFVLKKFGRVDVLVNNAGVMFDAGRSKPEGRVARWIKTLPKKMDFGEGQGILEVGIDIVRASVEVNTLGALRMCQAFIPLMIKARYGRVVNVSSSLGQLNGMTDEDRVPAYQLSKAALNAVTLMAADDCRDKNVTVNSVCPGWTRTSLGGPRAPQSVGEAAENIVWMANYPDGGPTGEFFRDKKAIEW